MGSGSATGIGAGEEETAGILMSRWQLGQAKYYLTESGRKREECDNVGNAEEHHDPRNAGSRYER